MKRISAFAVSVCLLFLSTVACADDFILKSSVSGTSFDWREGSNYEGGVAPSAGDFVQIPEGVTAKLSAGDAWWDFVSTLGRIRPMTATSYFQVDVPAGVTNALACEVTCTAANEKASMNKGGLVKTGSGCLDLMVGKYTHFTRLSATEGRLRLREAADLAKYYFDILNVASDAVLELMTAESIVCHTFSGDGEITTDQKATLQTFSNDTEFTFDGRLTGSLKLYALNTIYLTATDSTASGALNVATSSDIAEKGGISMLGLARFGNRGGTGSIGNPSTWSLGTSASAGGLLYLGNGETTDRHFALKAVNDGPFVFDGGASGGLTLAGGNISIEAKDAALNHRIVLCGSNQTACVFADKLVERLDANDVRVAYHLLKRGAGTWRLSSASYSATQLPWSGATSVEEGVLQFESLAEAGVLCSLGSATNLYSAYTGAPDDSKRVTWAMSLGTPTTAGTLEYVGAENVDCRTRPILMKGDGTLANSTEQAFRFFGVSAEAGTSPTLTLAGTGAGGNILSGVTDTDQAPLSIAKTGSGTWTLSTNVAFHGSLDVCEGRLNVNAGSRYTWFRFTVTENYGDASKAAAACFAVRKLAFFDKDGICQTVGLSFAEDYRSLQPGQFAYGAEYVTKKDKTYPYVTDERPWTLLFSEEENYTSVTLADVPTAGEPSTAFPLIIRLPEGANPIASFDICYNTSSGGNGRVNQPKAFTLEGSTDGLTWTPLLSKSDIVSPGSGAWLKSGLASSKTMPLATTPYLDGDDIAAPAVRPNPLASVSQVSVAAGATLASESGRTTVSSLKLDIVNGMGTFKGVDFAATGTVELVGEFGHQVPSATLIDCTGFSNVSNWTVMRNSKVISTRLVTTDDGAITVIRPGMVLSFK